MSSIPAASVKRISAAVPKFRKILIKAKERDVNESDTVTIVTDILEEVFGFDKYTEITREYSIQGTFCDLAIKSAKRDRLSYRSQSNRHRFKRHSSSTGCRLRIERRYQVGSSYKWYLLGSPSSNCRHSCRKQEND